METNAASPHIISLTAAKPAAVFLYPVFAKNVI